MERMIKGKAVIFDMDGVIFDSERLVVEAWKIVADRHGIPDVESACRAALGLNQYASADKFCEIYGADFPYWDYKYEMRDIYHNVLYGEHLPVKTGAEELLCALRQAGIPTALASSTREAVVRKELSDAGLTDHFDYIIGGDQVTKGKPDPEIFLLAASALKVEPAEAWVIEDSFNGIRAARAAGMMPVMVPDRVEPDEEIRALTISVCRDLREVMRMLLPV